MPIQGYQLISTVSENLDTITYRALREKDGANVLIKTCRRSNDFNQLNRLKHEYEILKSLDVEGVVKPYSLIKTDHKLAISMEDAEGIPLNEFSSFIRKDDLSIKLKIASKVAKCLHAIHQSRIIHRSIQSKNILINPKTKNITVIDFSSATRFSRSHGAIVGTRNLQESYAYISPEETGRMNRRVDSRTDLYSLGITLYEFMTGKLPFDASEPLEWVYAHIATPPKRVNDELPDIPPIISSIIDKLLSKNVEDRYRSAFGVYSDLETLLQMISSKKPVIDFPIGKNDPPSEFGVSQKIYGRENEVETLLTTFNKVASGHSEVLLISGYSGVGKTALVGEIYKPIIAKHGFFISGKFDQFKQNTPYSGIILAYQDFLHQILTESEENINIWKSKILNAVGSNGQVVTNVIPELELIIGKQPKLQILDATETENRFTLVFTEFQKALCRKEHPVVMFIDDLQWVDSASLKLIKRLIMQTEPKYLFFIGAYRDNEVTQTHKLKIFLDEVQRAGKKLKSLVLQPLDLPHVNLIISNTLGSDEKTSLPLSRLIYDKTQGNPFFINQFLHSLYERNNISFNTETNGWQWDIEAVRNQSITDNVVEFLTEKIHTLPLGTQEHLKVASCTGNFFDLKTTSVISGYTLAESINLLNGAVKDGLIIPSSEIFSTLGSGEYAEKILKETPITFKFLHDRIQQAAYQLSTEKEKKLIHSKIGNLLLKKFLVDKIDDSLFEIANHLNLTDPPKTIEKRFELAELNLLAGKKAKSSSAYEPALKYLRAGLNLLPPSKKWDENYRLAFDLHLNIAETLSALAEMHEAERYFKVLIENAETDFDKGIVYDKYSIFLQSSGKALDALLVTKKGLELFQIHFPTAQEDIEKEAERMMEELTHPEILARLLKLPMASSRDILIGRIYDRCNVGTYFADPKNLPFVICKNLKHVLEFGITPESGLAIAWFAMILGMNEKKELSFQFADVGLTIMARFDDPYFKGKTDMITHGQSLCWRHTFKESEQMLNEAFALCHSNGELQYASYARIISYISTIAQSSDCQHVLDSCQLWHDYCEKYVPLELGQAKIRLYLMKGLIGLPREEIDPEGIIDEYQAANNATDVVESLVELARIATLYGDFKNGYQYFARAEPIMVAGGAGNLLLVMLFYHGYALCCAKLYATEKDEKFLDQLNAHLEKLKIWSELNPTNFFSYYTLVAAEKERALGNDSIAIELYKDAISHAQKNEYILLQAYSNEYLATLYSLKGDPSARSYYEEAIFLYNQCGARSKSAQLHIYTNGEAVEAGVSEAESLDLTSIMKTVEILSSTIVLDDFINQALKILIENAGAQRVVLITGSKDELFVDADAGPGSTAHFAHMPFEDYARLPLSLINLVKRSHESVVLDDARKGYFADPYFFREKPRSVLCMPMFRSGKLCGILYFENNLTADVFSKQRLQVLKIISTQVAISLENARFYKDLELKVKERTKELELERSKAINASRLTTLGQMAGGIAHEMNNPLMIIEGNAKRMQSILSQSTLDPITMKKSLSVIIKMTERISKIVKSLLLFSGHGENLNPTPLDASYEIQEVLALCAEKMKSHGIALFFEVPRKKLTILFVRQHLRHVLLSLLNNSFDALKDRSDEKWIRIEVGAQDSHVAISITDSGYLTDKAIREKLFDPFFTTKTLGHGMGLSLSVAKGILEELSGSIVFDATSEHTRFIIHLPKATGLQLPILPLDPDTRSSEAFT